MVLVDSSVWVEVFRARRGVVLEDLLPFDDIVTCLPVIQEVLQGFRDEAAFRIAREAMAALPIVDSPIPAEVFDRAVEVYRTARRAGITVRSSVDCLIAASALRHGLTVLHRDRDFDKLSQVVPLQVRSV